jgi:hypothetical protein
MFVDGLLRSCGSNVDVLHAPSVLRELCYVIPFGTGNFYTVQTTRHLNFGSPPNAHGTL